MLEESFIRVLHLNVKDCIITPMSNQLPAFIIPGARVEWDTWCGPTYGTVTHVGSDHVTVETRNGHSEIYFSSCFRTLAEVTSFLRPAVAA